MRSPTPTPTSPLRFLLYLEWILLLIIAFSELLAFRRFPRSPLLNLTCLALFGVLGLKLPPNKSLYKILYTSLEIALILLAAFEGGIRLFPLLYIILVIRNSFIFERYGRLAATGFAYLLLLFNLIHRLQHRPVLRRLIISERLGFLVIGFAVLSGLVLLFLQLLVNAILAERQSREQLALANAQLRQYALRIEDIATLQERNRIAREIHDSLGHALTVLNLHLEAALKLQQSDPKTATEFLADAKQLGSTALEEVRLSVASLRSDPLQGQTLADAIASLTDEFQRSTGISPQCRFNQQRALPPEVKTAVYRIVQEALTNIYKYAEATEVNVELTATATELHLTIADNGKGFDRDRNTTGFGLAGMRERTLALGGHFEIVTAPRAGCQIIATLPLPRP